MTSSLHSQPFSKGSNSKSSKIKDKENLCESFESFDFEKIEKDLKKPGGSKVDKSLRALQERDCNIPSEEEFEFPLKNVKKEGLHQKKKNEEKEELEFSDSKENQKILQEEDQELKKKIDGSLKPYGFDSIEQLQAEAMKIQLEEEGLDEFLAVPQEIKITNLEIERQERYRLVKETFEKGLQEFEFEGIEDVKEELEIAVGKEQRFKEAKRSTAAEKEQSKIRRFKDLIEVWEEIQKLEFEEELRQAEQTKQEKLALFKKGLEELDLISLQDVEDDLKAARKEAERLGNKPGREKALQDIQTKIKKLEDLLLAGQEVEKFLLEEEFKQYQKKIKEKEETFKKDLESFQLTSVEDVREDLKAASEDVKRLGSKPGRERALQDALKRVQGLEGLMEKWGGIERLGTEDKERQNRLQREEQEISPPKYLENPALSADIIEPSVREEVPPFDEPNLEDPPNLDAEIPSDQEKQNLKTELDNLNEEASLMPNCFEKFLILLNILVLRKFHSEYSESESSEFVSVEIPKVLDSLYQRAKTEMLDTKSMKRTLDEISFKIRNADWGSAKESLRLLLKQIQPLSIAETKRLIKKGSEAATLVGGKDAIIFIGGAGAGKSTTLLYLSGARIIKKVLKQGYHYLPVEIKNPVLAGVTTSASSASETRYIKCVPVQLMDVGISKKGFAYFLDLPGYDDSAGAEVDISNAVNIFRTIAECKSVKPLVLISKKSLGERMKGIKILARILASVLPGIKQGTESSPFIYLFTKFSDEEIKFVEGSIKDVLAKLTPDEEADDGFCHILEDILYKIEGGIQTIDPLASEQAKKILRGILDSSSIPQPDQVFKFSIAEDSKATLQKQCRLNQETIRSATERMDFEHAIYKLSQLKELSELVSLEFIEKDYKDSIQFVGKFLQTHYQTSVEKFTRCLKDGNTLEDNEIKEFVAKTKEAQAADSLRSEYLPEEVPSSSAFTQTVAAQTRQLLTKIQQSSITELSLKSKLEKLQLLSQHFMDIKPELENSINYLKTILNEENESFKSLHLNGEFDKSAELFEDISSFMERLGVYLNEDFVKEKKKMIEEFLCGNIEETGSGLDVVFHKKRINLEDEKSLQKKLTRLRHMKEKYKVQLDTIKSVYQRIIQRILDYLKEANREITKLYEEEKYDGLSDVERHFKEIVLLRNIPEIAAESHHIYSETFITLRGILNQVKNDIVEEIKKCQSKQTDEDFDYEKLHKCLMAFQSMSGMDGFNQDNFAKTKRTIEREVMKHSETHKKQLEKLELDLDNYEQLEKANQIASKLKEILVFQEFLPILGQNKDIIQTHFEEKVEATLNVIQSHLDVWNSSIGKSLDKKRVEKSLLYLKKCHELSLFKQKSPILLRELETFIENSSQRDFEQLEKCYQEIMSYDGAQNNGELGNSMRTSVIFTQVQEDPSSNPNSNNELSDNISSVSERSEMNFLTNKERLAPNARTMLKLLKQTLQLQRDFPNLYHIYDAGEEPIIDFWKGRLNSDLKDLSEQMLKLSTSVNRSQDLQKKLHISRALSLLDEFMEGEKFINIYEKYQSAHYAQTAKKFSEYIENIKNGDYNPISKNIKYLRNCNLEEMACSEQYEELKNCLSESLENLMVDIISMTQQTFIDKGLLHPSKINSIAANIKKLQKAQECFESQDLTFSVNKFKECDEKVRKIISQELMGIAKEYENLISSQCYTEAELQRDRLDQICSFLGEKWLEDLEQKKTELDEIRQKGVEKMVKSFKERPICDYVYYSPKKVYLRLELGRDAKFYQNMLEPFAALIEEKCWNEVKRIESLDITQRLDCVKTLQSLLNYLPQPVEVNLSKKLEKLEGDLNKVRQNYTSELQSVKRNGNTKDTVNLLKRLKEMKMEQDLKDLEEHIEKEVQQLKSHIMKNLHSKNIENALKQFKELAEKNMIFDGQDINQMYLDVRTNLMQIVQNWYTSFLKGLNFPDIIANDKINGGEVEQNFVCLMEFLKFKKNDEKVGHILDGFLSNAQIEDMNKLIMDRVKNYQRSCSEAFDNFDFSKISKARKFAKNCSSLLEHFKTYAMGHADQYSDLSQLSSMLDEVESEASLEEKLCQIVSELGDEVLNIELINEETKKFSKPRDEFYSNLDRKLSNLEKAKKFEGLDLDVKSLLKRCCERINSQRDEMYQVLERLVEQIWDNDIQQEEYDQFNVYYNNLAAIKKNLKFLKGNNFDLEAIERTFKRKIGLYAQEIQSESNNSLLLKKMAEGLLKLKALSLNVSVFKSYTEGKINDILNSYKAAKGTVNIPKLAKLLTLDQKGYGSRVVSDCQVFKGVANEIFNSRTQKHDIDYVLKNLRGSDIDRALLGKRYEDFFEKYRQLTDHYLKPDLDLSELVYKTKKLAGNTHQTNEEIHWNSEMVAKIPELLAHIFAIWTLQNAGGYFETDDSMNKQNYLLQPHAAQVISIFRLLGVGEKTSKLQNNLAQIGTGEGKSITLAVTAIVLTLFGFTVFSACYSSYLCDRDYNAFSSLFNLLDVSEKITYGTFNKICEDVINQDGDVRKLVENLFTCKDANTFLSTVKNKSSCPSILLIDEVDVFFSKEFYGRLYTPSASIRDPTITKLIDLLWQNRASQQTFLQVQETQEYQDCRAQFPNFKEVIQEAVKDMLYDLKVFESHDYIVKDDKIGYKQCENISFKIRNRYQTLFAYYLENERQNISPESLEENKKLIIKCGSYSYAEIIRQFKFIMGVTGTLEHLSKMEKQVIEDEYQIKKNTFLPSVFGENKLKYEEKADIIIAKEIDYFNTLKEEIVNRLNSGKASNAKRAVLVFFESDKKLLEFLNSKQMADMKDQIEYLTEEANAEEKENIVKRATSSGRITFFTRSFGRGTDFVVHDQEVSSNGGIHVLQTFLSEERSEEVQIRGRTARQGDQGSFSMVILDMSLEKFFILPEDIEKVKKEGRAWYRFVRVITLDSVEYKNIYELMNARRNELFAQGYKNNEKCVIEAREMHKPAMKFLQDISSRNMDAIRLFLFQENKGASEVRKSRTIILTDGTGSMSPLHQNTKTTIIRTCTNTASILKDYKIPEDCFQLQFVVYRNYNSKEDKLLQFSTWETKPNNLTPFLESIEVEGGWGNEAIEVGLSYANQEHEKEPISQIILIGDAPANSEQEVDERRKRYKESYWSTTKFAAKTTWKKEVDKLKQNKIPVHSFYMTESAKVNFTEISNATGGKCAPLDIYSDAGATVLTNLVTEVLLKEIGEQNGKGDELVQAFRNKIIQSYTE